MARRDLLGLGATVALSLAASSCRGAENVAHVSPATKSPSPTRPKRTPPAPVTPAYAGQPPPGHLYYGASVPDDRSLPKWERELGTTIAVNRSYFTPDRNETSQLIQCCRDDLAHQRLSHMSTKAPSTWAGVAAGDHDDWLSDIFRRLDAEHGPVFFTLHHEPENDAGPAGMKAADFVGMQQRAIRLAARLAPQVTIVPIIQHWTFDPMNVGSDPAAWIVRDASVLGFDVYNPWAPANGKLWRSFGSRVDDVLSWFGDAPIVIGEYGCREHPDDPDLASEWMRDAAEYARGHNLVSMSYFNSAVHSPDGSYALEGRAEQMFARLLNSDWVARPG
jgi:hypothetical protein